MKIEKLNDNQIRCTLTKDDLAQRQIRLSELAYGSEKARALFRDMIKKANAELGFNAVESPLMVEAIPTSEEEIVLLITKYEYPDELDTRFSRFTDPDMGLYDHLPNGKEHKQIQSVSDIIDIFKNAHEAKKEKPGDEAFKEQLRKQLDSMQRTFWFADLSDAIRLASALKNRIYGETYLCKDTREGGYYLILCKGDLSPEEFNRVCNIAVEFASKQIPAGTLNRNYFKEHDAVIIEKHAIETLTELA